MNKQQYRDKLYKKALKEFEIFKKEQLKESKESIFNNASKIAILNDFMIMCDKEYDYFSLDEVQSLLKNEYPLDTLYNYYIKSDVGSFSDIHEAIWYKLRDGVKEMNQNKKLENQNKER